MLENSPSLNPLSHNDDFSVEKKAFRKYYGKGENSFDKHFVLSHIVFYHMKYRFNSLGNI